MSTRRAVAVLAGAVALAAIHPPVADAGLSYTQLGGGSNKSAALAWSDALFADGSASEVVLARDDLFADSLAAGALAARIDGPLLLTDNETFDPALGSELTRLGVSTVYILGGTAAVSQDMEDSLVADGYTVVRYAGPNRVATAATVANDHAGYDAPPATSLFIARAFGDDTDATRAFADSLGAGMAAGSQLDPLVVTATAGLSPDVRAYLEDDPPISGLVHVAGGTAAVSVAVVDELEAMGFDVVRDAGGDRFETAAALADLSYARDPGDHLVALVDGRDADGWVSAFAASAHGPGGAVVLADGDDLPAATVAWLEANGPSQLYCGPDVAESTCSDANAILNG